MGKEVVKMAARLWRLILFVLLFRYLYKNRYRLAIGILEYELWRRLALRLTLGIPAVRNHFFRFLFPV